MAGRGCIRRGMLLGGWALSVLWIGQTHAQPAGYDKQTLIESFTSFDRSVNGGKAYSESASSASLAWGESYYLNAYIKMYHVTGDAAWLDKVVEHFDRMMANMSDHDGDGIPAWHTDRYSVSRIRSVALHNRGTAKISPEEARVTNIDQAHEAVDAVYVAEMMGYDRMRVRDITRWELKYDGPYSVGQEIPGIVGFSVKPDRQPEPGDKFRIQTWGVGPLDYAVHDGMILYPVAQFIEMALHREDLQGRYEEKARSYLRLIEERILAKQERYWLEVEPGMGGYRSTSSGWERYSNRILPHNQYLALGRAYLVLKDASDNPLFLERATLMARHFRRHLQETGSAYTWSYWDWVEAGAPDQSNVEDTSHGHIDIEFAVEAYRRGVVFTQADMERLARTLTDQMWNGSLDDPTVGSRVDRRTGEGNTIRGWIELCRWDSRIWDLYWGLYNKLNQPGLETPHIMYARAVLDGFETPGAALPPGAPLYESELGGNHPNPFNGETEVRFTVGGHGPFERQSVLLRIYNVLGQQVRVLMEGGLPSGTHRIVWDGRDQRGRELGSGIYLCAMSTEAYRKVEKMMLVR